MKILIYLTAFLFFFSFAGAKEKNVSIKSTKPIVIDVRTEAEFNAGNIQGSVLIPFDVINTKIAEITTDKSAKIILYCRSGRRSGIAESVLKEMGYVNVENYGSMQSTKEKLEIK